MTQPRRRTYQDYGLAATPKPTSDLLARYRRRQGERIAQVSPGGLEAAGPTMAGGYPDTRDGRQTVGGTPVTTTPNTDVYTDQQQWMNQQDPALMADLEAAKRAGVTVDALRAAREQYGTPPPPSPSAAMPSQRPENQQPATADWAKSYSGAGAPAPSGTNTQKPPERRLSNTEASSVRTGSSVQGPSPDVGLNQNKPMNQPQGSKGPAYWWRRPQAYANGVMGAPGGQALVGERGPEEVQIPGLGSMMVGENGPEVREIPKGANVIPMDQKYLYTQIQRAAQAGSVAGEPDPEGAAERANDPQLQQKVIEAIKKAMAASYAASPPNTPILTDPRVKDRWAMWRPLTGTPAQDPAMVQEAQ